MRQHPYPLPQRGGEATWRRGRGVALPIIRRQLGGGKGKVAFGLLVRGKLPPSPPSCLPQNMRQHPSSSPPLWGKGCCLTPPPPLPFGVRGVASPPQRGRGVAAYHIWGKGKVAFINNVILGKGCCLFPLLLPSPTPYPSKLPKG